MQKLLPDSSRVSGSMTSRKLSNDSKSTKGKTLRLEKILKKTDSLISEIFYTQRSREGVVHTEPDSQNHLFTEFVENSDITEALYGQTSKNRCLSIPDLSEISEKMTGSRKNSLNTLLKSARKEIFFPSLKIKKSSFSNLNLESIYQGEDSKGIPSSETSTRQLYDLNDRIRDSSIDRKMKENSSVSEIKSEKETKLKIKNFASVHRKANSLVLDDLSNKLENFKKIASHPLEFHGQSGSRTQRLRDKLAASKSVIQPLSLNELVHLTRKESSSLLTEDRCGENIKANAPEVVQSQLPSPIQEEEQESPKVEKIEQREKQEQEEQKQPPRLKNLLKIRTSLRTKTFNLSDQTRLDLISNDDEKHNKLIFKNLSIKPNKSIPNKNVRRSETLISETSDQNKESSIEFTKPVLRQVKHMKRAASVSLSISHNENLNESSKGLFYYRLKGLENVAGDFVSPQLRSKRPISEEDRFQLPIKKAEPTMKEQKTMSSTFKFQKQSKLKHRAQQVGIRSFLFEEDKEYSQNLEKEFLKSLNQALTENKEKPVTSLSCLEKEDKGILIQQDLQISSLGSLYHGDMVGQDFSKFIQRFEEKVTASDLPQENNNMTFSQSNHRETLVIKIKPPLNKMTFSIKEEFSDLEESNGCNTPAKGSQSSVYNSRKVAAEDGPSYSYTVSHREDKLDNICETLSKSKVVDAQTFEDVSQNIEDMFKFDEIYPSYLANLKVKSQRLRIKSNFLSFVGSLCNWQSEERIDLHFPNEDSERRRDCYPVETKDAFDLNQKFVDDLNHVDIFNILKVIGSQPDEGQMESSFDFPETADKIKALTTFTFEPHQNIPRLLFRHQIDTKPSKEFKKNYLLTYLKSTEIFDVMKKHAKLELKTYPLKLESQEDFAQKQSEIGKLLMQSNHENLQYISKLLFSAFRTLLNGDFENMLGLENHQKNENLDLTKRNSNPYNSKRERVN